MKLEIIELDNTNLSEFTELFASSQIWEEIREDGVSHTEFLESLPCQDIVGCKVDGKLAAAVTWDLRTNVTVDYHLAVAPKYRIVSYRIVEALENHFIEKGFLGAITEVPRRAEHVHSFLYLYGFKKIGDLLNARMKDQELIDLTCFYKKFEV